MDVLEGNVRDLVFRAAERWPDRTAIADARDAITYAELARRVGVAGCVLDRLGVETGAHVGLQVERSADAVAAFIALMCAGVAVAVLPETSSAATLGAIRDIDIKLMVFSGDAPVTDTDVLSTSLDGLKAAGAEVRSRTIGGTAYITLTSGTTGRSKAIIVSHANVLHYASGLIDRLGLDAANPLRFGHLTTLAADLGYTCIFPALLIGGAIHVASDDVARDAMGFWDWAERERPRVVKTTPSHFRGLLDGRLTGAWRFDTLILGGEILDVGLVRDILERGAARRLVNHYGPSETTVGAACKIIHAISDIPEDARSMAIGTPIGAAELRLCSREGRGHTIADAVGELLIGGPGVTGGYFGRPELTADRFHQTDDGARVFRSRDLCRQLPNGDFEFIRRLDRQIKIRGFAIDPGQVEDVIVALPGVSKVAVTTLDGSGHTRLVAAVEFRSATPNRSDDLSDDKKVQGLRDALVERLPPWMLPAPLIRVDRLPLNANGKIDYQRVSSLIAEDVAKRGLIGEGTGDSRIADSRSLDERIAAILSSLLGVNALPFDQDLIEAGADSIVVMRFVAKLRLEGIPIAIEDVYAYPTVATLAARLSRVPVDIARERDAPRVIAAKSLAPIQKWFLDLPIADKNHWNQALLLQTREKVDPFAMSRAVAVVCRRHELLRHSFVDGKPGEASDDAALLTFGMTPLPDDSPIEREKALRSSCAQLQTTMDLARGILIKVHLFQSASGADDRILMIVHHLAVDGVSWHLLLDDLASAYSAFRNGEEWYSAAAPSFWEWTSSVARPADDDVEPSTGGREILFPEKPGATAPEQPIGALILGLSPSETAEFIAAAGTSADLEAVLLQAFVDATADVAACDSVLVDVEAHGRTAGPDAERFFATVGWFTTVGQVRIAAGPSKDFIGRLGSLRSKVTGNAPSPIGVGGRTAELCFNFLGHFVLPSPIGVDWKPAPELPGPARNEAGDRLYKARLTARVVEGRLIIDLVHDRLYIPDETSEAILAAFRRRLSCLTPGCSAPGALRRASQSTSGLILLAPRLPSAGASSVIERQPVLLTGATGFLGAHLLRELLVGDDVAPLCLVRGETDESARRRLLDGYERYFGLRAARLAGERIQVCRGDIRLPGLGVAIDESRLAQTQAIYHTAAATRLFGSHRQLDSVNVDGSRHVCEWAARTSGVPLHYVSTLAVAGALPGSSKRRFSEDDFALGQTSLSVYEASKYAAEEIVRASLETRRSTFIYRMGHVAADSESGRFQHNIADNRIYQTLKAYVVTGLAPRGPHQGVSFSYVDIVARAIAALSGSPDVVPGTYHLENPSRVSTETIVEWMNGFGYEIVLTSPDAYGHALHNRVLASGDTSIIAAQQWARRADRNIEYDCERSVARMLRLGVSFRQPDEAWFHKLLRYAVDAEFLPPPRSTALSAHRSRGVGKALHEEV